MVRCASYRCRTGVEQVSKAGPTRENGLPIQSKEETRDGDEEETHGFGDRKTDERRNRHRPEGTEPASVDPPPDKNVRRVGGKNGVGRPLFRNSKPDSPNDRTAGARRL